MKSLFTSCLRLTLLLALKVHANTMQSTQTQLQELNVQINQLEKTLHHANSQRGSLHKELVLTEKQISEGVQALRKIQSNIHEKSYMISALQNQIQRQNQQLVKQQQMLASHVRARYQMGEYQALKSLLIQEDPAKISRINTYYLYLINSRQKLIDEIDSTKTHLHQSQDALQQELTNNQKLHVQLTTHQQSLEKTKNYHTQLLGSLSQDIQTKQQRLQEAQKNKNNLGLLLKKLSQKPLVVPQKNQFSFQQMRQKLPLPVHSPKKIERLHQGVTFFADEGTTVTAVHPGTVIFSDWLKGYGLLLILDHGQGFMSLYAHNESLFKRKGSHVQQNEAIASVGHSGGIKQNGLYFEIRLRGKAIPPLAWLSKK